MQIVGAEAPARYAVYGNRAQAIRRREGKSKGSYPVRACSFLDGHGNTLDMTAAPVDYLITVMSIISLFDCPGHRTFPKSGLCCCPLPLVRVNERINTFCPTKRIRDHKRSNAT